MNLSGAPEGGQVRCRGVSSPEPGSVRDAGPAASCTGTLPVVGHRQAGSTPRLGGVLRGAVEPLGHGSPVPVAGFALLAGLPAWRRLAGALRQVPGGPPFRSLPTRPQCRFARRGDMDTSREHWWKRVAWLQYAALGTTTSAARPIGGFSPDDPQRALWQAALDGTNGSSLLCWAR
jgi:hypothetical protein